MVSNFLYNICLTLYVVLVVDLYLFLSTEGGSFSDDGWAKLRQDPEVKMVSIKD